MLLFCLAAFSILGTLIPQNEDPAAYIRALGEFGYRFFSVLGFLNMYHSWWFRLLLGLLAINIIVCSIDRLRKTWDVIFTKNPVFSLSSFRKKKHRYEFFAPGSLSVLEEAVSGFLSKRFGYVTCRKTDEGAALFAERFRWTRLGVYIVHLSIVLLLLGGIIGSMFGFEGYVNIPEGESASVVHLRNSNQVVSLPFEVRCDDFSVSFYKDGTPKEYRSSLSILEQGRVVLKKDIIVNDPLRYKGINIFQSSYGTDSAKSVTITFTSMASGLAYERTLLFNKPVDLPENLGKFEVIRFDPTGLFRGHRIGETFIAEYTPKKGKPTIILLPVKFPTFDRMRQGSFVASVTDYEARYFTGLQVTKDPGVWVVYCGFIMIIAGCIITFFMSHQRICVDIKAGEKGADITVTGSSSRNRIGMRNRVMSTGERIQKMLQAQSSGVLLKKNKQAKRG